MPTSMNMHSEHAPRDEYEDARGREQEAAHESRSARAAEIEAEIEVEVEVEGRGTGEGSGAAEGRGGVEIDPILWKSFVEATGFMPESEARALYTAAANAAELGDLVEIGTYQGKSAILLAGAARTHGRKLLTVDHHRGSEEHQPGWEYHDPDLVDPAVGLIDTLPLARRALALAGVEDSAVLVVGRSADVAALWAGPAAFVFIDGGHTDEAAQTDYAGWAPKLMSGGVLAIHDVFPDPADGGQAPYRIYLRALESGEYDEFEGEGSLRLLRRR